MKNDNKSDIYTINGVKIKVTRTFGDVPVKKILFNIVTAQLKEQKSNNLIKMV